MHLLQENDSHFSEHLDNRFVTVTFQENYNIIHTKSEVN